MRDLGDRSFEPGEDVGTGVVADGAGEHPSDVHVGQVQGVGELAFERRTAMGDGVALEEPRLRLDEPPRCCLLYTLTLPTTIGV